MDRARFVPEVNHAQRRVIHRVEHVQDMVSSDPEDGIDSLGYERADQEIATGGFVHFFEFQKGLAVQNEQEFKDDFR